MRCAKVLQLTLAVIKPDAVAHPLILEALHQKILENFIIIRKRDLVWRREDSEKFYAEHAGRFFYQRLVEFMSSGPMRAYILARDDAVTHWRGMMGPTKVFRARFTSPNTLRGQYGLTDTRNTTHGSDSTESAKREIAFSSQNSLQMTGWRGRSKGLGLDLLNIMSRAKFILYKKQDNHKPAVIDGLVDLQISMLH